MIRWFLRGVSHRRLTTRFPRSPEPAPAGFRARALLDPDVATQDAERIVQACLPGALTLDGGGRLRLDASRCIGCGLCLEACDDGSIAIDPGYELAATSRSQLAVGDDGREADISPSRLGGAFRRSLHIRHVDTGSDGAIEQEIAALLNPYYDMHRLGLFFTASPRHADVLLVTGPVTRPMEQPLRRTYDAMPEPRVVIAAGTDACSGSVWTEPDVQGGVDRVIPVDVYVPGDPPSPIALLHALLLAADRVGEVSPPRRERAVSGIDHNRVGGAV
ncbi:MAG TPA: 4Fe-4S binding protein [Solirubrobacteraceae bacterium]|nr:4Fe-4S binding protein [Solirubrobacteraceae bacterium]